MKNGVHVNEVLNTPSCQFRVKKVMKNSTIFSVLGNEFKLTDKGAFSHANRIPPGTCALGLERHQKNDIKMAVALFRIEKNYF